MNHSEENIVTAQGLLRVSRDEVVNLINESGISSSAFVDACRDGWTPLSDVHPGQWADILRDPCHSTLRDTAGRHGWGRWWPIVKTWRRIVQWFKTKEAT